MLTLQQALFAICSIYPQLSITDNGRGFFLCTPDMDGAEQTKDAMIVAWNLSDIAQPTAEELAAAWSANGDLMLASVPPSVSRRQGKLALVQQGIYDQFKGIVDAGSPRLQIAFYDSVDWLRNDPDLIDAARQGGLSDSQIDDLFVLANSL